MIQIIRFLQSKNKDVSEGISHKLCWLDNKARDLNAANEMYKGFIESQELTAQFEAWCRFSF